MLTRSSKRSSDAICVRRVRNTRRRSNQQEVQFCSLPTEILELIFQHLNPRDLLSIRSLCVRRLSEIVQNIKKADFSTCNDIQTEEMLSFFSRDQAQCIQEINFNNVFFVKSALLEKCATKCKHLKKLYAYECGLSYKNIIRVLDQCKELEELHWSVTKFELESEIKVTSKVKKLHLSYQNGDILGLLLLLEKCGNLKELCLNLSPSFSISLPPHASNTSMIYAYNFNHIPNCDVKFIVRCLLKDCDSFTKDFMEVLRGADNFNVETPQEEEENTVSHFFINQVPRLQMVTEAKELSIIPTLPDHSVESLVLILTESRHLLTDHMEKFTRVTGKKLKQFTAIHMPDRESREELEIPASYFIHHISVMISCCRNIQILNLCELHFEWCFPFRIVSCLKQLKVLTLPACSLQTARDENQGNFDDMVLRCRNLEKFSLLGCLACYEGPSEATLMSVCKWHKLTHITMEKVFSICSCHFLSNITDYCPNLTSLEVIELGELSVCHYIKNVIRVLRKSKLKFLRINQKAFYPKNTLFWKSISVCRTLQGLCMSTDVNTAIENKMMMDALKELPSLHVFHLYSKRVGTVLSTRIRRMMTEKGVKHQDVEISAQTQRFAEIRRCVRPHFPVY